MHHNFVKVDGRHRKRRRKFLCGYSGRPTIRKKWSEKKCFLLVLNSITSKAMGFWTMPGKSQNDKRKKKKKGKLEKEGGVRGGRGGGEWIA